MNYTYFPPDGEDFEPRNETVIFAPDEDKKIVRVRILNDTVDEPDKTFKVVITPVSGDVDIRVGEANVTIVDDESEFYYVHSVYSGSLIADARGSYQTYSYSLILFQSLTLSSRSSVTLWRKVTL